MWTHRPTGLRGEADESRSQAENLKWALFRLLAEALDRIVLYKFDLAATTSYGSTRDRVLADSPSS